MLLKKMNLEWILNWEFLKGNLVAGVGFEPTTFGL